MKTRARWLTTALYYLILLTIVFSPRPSGRSSANHRGMTCAFVMMDTFIFFFSSTGRNERQRLQRNLPWRDERLGEDSLGIPDEQGFRSPERGLGPYYPFFPLPTAGCGLFQVFTSQSSAVDFEVSHRRRITGSQTPARETPLSPAHSSKSLTIACWQRLP